MTVAYLAVLIPPGLVSLALVLAVVRANKDDLPEIVRALMRIGPRDTARRNGHEADRVKLPPSLPKA
jgi:hypothetical protein